MKRLLPILLPSLFVLFYSCQTEQPWQPLFNGENLENWDMHIGPALRGFDSLAQTATTDKIFSVVEENGEKLIRISGEVNASLATQDTLSNYHLQLVFKWGDEVYTSRNSGLLYHSFGDFNETTSAWIENIECQMMHERLGDSYLMFNTYCEVPVVKVEEGFQYDRDGEMTKFSKDEETKRIIKGMDAENPLGEWNTLELYSVGRTTVHVVNGQVVMVNYNTGIIENGTVSPLTSGKIQIQSEGGELFVRTVQYKNIEEIPAEILQ